MTFDSKRFASAKHEARTEMVPVPALSAWYDKGEKPEWEVRGLSHAELANADNAGERNKAAGLILQALSGTDIEKIAAVKEVIGITGDDVPHETTKRMAMLVTGSTNPEIELETAVKLATTNPIEFSVLTNKIVELTGKGQVLSMGKPKPSGKTQQSKAS